MNKEREMNMTAQEITGRRIKMLRIKKGYSQTKLAEMVGYKDKTAIAKIEAGKVDLPLSKIMAFSTALSTDMYYLLDNISDMEEPQKNISKTLGILIPDGCKQIYVFENESDFLSAVQSGQMIPLYGAKRHEKDYLPLYIAQKGDEKHDHSHCMDCVSDMHIHYE